MQTSNFSAAGTTAALFVVIGTSQILGGSLTTNPHPNLFEGLTIGLTDQYEGSNFRAITTLDKPYVPKRRIVRRLLELREQAIAEGMKLMTLDEVNEELSNNRKRSFD